MAVLVIAPALLLGALYAGKSVWHWWSARNLQTLNDQAENFYAKRNLEGAAQTLREIMQRDPLNERALRLWAHILDDSPHNPEDAVAVWRKLCGTPRAGTSDLAMLGCALIRASRHQEAKAVWEQLPESERTARSGLELRAGLLRYEGGPREADLILRQAYEADPQNPESRLKLAALDMASNFPEIRSRAATGVWEMARTGQENLAVSAMQLLASTAELSTSQAKELRDRLDHLTDVTGAPRYAVLSGCMKALPLEHDQILDQEIKRHAGKLDEGSVEFLRWLIKNHEAQRVLKLLDKNTATHSASLFSLYAEALNETGQWQELRALLNSSGTMPISPAMAAVMLARCSNKLNESTANTRSHLQEALHHSRSHHSLPELFMTASTAEEMGFADVALAGYDELSQHRAYKLTALDHILQIRHREGNLDGVVDALDTLLQDAPGLAPYLDLFCYHKILAGEEIEKTAQIAQHAIETGRQSSSTLHLAVALAAYRAHNLPAAKAEAENILSADLPAGQRAVLAGILGACGHMDEAFHLAEKISLGLLLKEETRFLKGVL